MFSFRIMQQGKTTKTFNYFSLQTVVVKYLDKVLFDILSARNSPFLLLTNDTNVVNMKYYKE